MKKGMDKIETKPVREKNKAAQELARLAMAKRNFTPEEGRRIALLRWKKPPQ